MTARPDGRGVDKSVDSDFSGEGPRNSIEAEIVEKLPDLPPAKRREVITVVQQVVEHHSGPLPPPRMLAEYDDILPGLAERIVAMTENDLAHLHRQQATMLAAEVRERTIGQLGAILVTLGALGASVWIAISGHPLTGGLLGGITLIGIVTILIGGRDYLLRKLDRQAPDPKVTHVKKPPRKRR